MNLHDVYLSAQLAGGNGTHIKSSILTAQDNMEGEMEIPHELTYKDGNITLDMTLISVR